MLALSFLVMILTASAILAGLMRLSGVSWRMLKAAYLAWRDDKAVRLGAALSYYTIFSLPPLLVLVVAVAALAYGREAVQGRLVEEFQGLVGQSGAAAVQTMIERASEPKKGIAATAIGFVLLVIGATGVLGQLQDALNTVWGVKPKPVEKLGGRIKDLVKARLLSFMLVVGIGSLLLVSLAVSAALAAFSGTLNAILPGAGMAGHVLQALDFAVSFGVAGILFAMIFKALPDAKVAWGDVWVGAAVTSLLFSVGKSLIGLYLGKGAVGSVYGAAGSVVVILLWVYYSSQILLYGAEFTQVYADAYGSGIKPKDYAELLTEKERAAQGMEPQKTKAGEDAEKKKAA